MNAKLEEYKQLRTEVLHFLKERQFKIYLAILITLSVVSIGYEKSNYWLFLSSVAIISFLWYDEIRRIEAIFRTAAYIQVFIESDIPDLKWETNIAKHKIHKSFLGRFITDAHFPTLMIINAIPGIKFLNEVHHKTSIVTAVIFVIILFLLIFKQYKVSTNGREKAVESWEVVKNKNTNMK